MTRVRLRVGDAVSPSDPRLTRGAGAYVDDRALPNQAHAVIVRSTHAHARIRRIDTRDARAAPGVLAVLTGAELDADGIGRPRTYRFPVPLCRPDGSPAHTASHPGLARDRVRWVGDPVALVVAETRALAGDAAERVEIDYEPLPAVVEARDALEDGRALVWDDCAGNVAALVRLGDAQAVARAFGGAALVVRERFVVTRVSAAQMEPRGCLGHYDAAEDRFMLYCDVQSPHTTRGLLARDVFDKPETAFRVIAGDIGGAFGIKGHVYPEPRLVLWAARRLGRPVKWCATRSEAFLADEHGRDAVADAALALDENGRMLALDVEVVVNLGAYTSSERSFIPMFANLGTFAGVYTIPAIRLESRGVYTNTPPTAPYRGAGRPEAAYVVERLVDAAARGLGLDPADLRRRNVIPPGAMPYRTALTYTYDVGEFGRTLERALELADHAGFEARRSEALARGRRRGFGISNTVERAGVPLPEHVEVRVGPDASVFVLAGTQDQGQGHRNMYRQLLCEHLGVAGERVRVIEGDTDAVAFGLGTFGSRSALSGGSSLVLAVEKVVEKGKRIAAHQLECDVADVGFAEGEFTVAGTDRAVSIEEVAAAAFVPARLPPGMEPGLSATGSFVPSAVTFPNGVHAVEVEVDEETGRVDVIAYVVVDDVGTVINPVAVKGQVHGGVAQGLGQALMEALAFDPVSGQLLTGSFLDYCMPRADDLCDIVVESHPVPTESNPIGVKGVGEAGTVGALPAVVNAVLDALAPLGVERIEMPLTPERVWRAIRGVRGSRPSQPPSP